MQIQLLLALIRAAAPSDQAVRVALEGVAYRISGHETIFARPLKAWLVRDPATQRERLRLDVTEGDTPARFVWDAQTGMLSALDPVAETYAEHSMPAGELVIPQLDSAEHGRCAGWGPWPEASWSRWREAGPTTSLTRLGHHGWALVQQFWSSDGALQGVHLAEPVALQGAAALAIPDHYRRT